ncbi:hypothetical protein [Streptomyces liangshanensis]|uniref:Tetratricopeptide repeat protein n=1 Tax=Streptomyces liangshanensis TaxID=2717324 RepID=A0A6G9GYN5_9ACTN|nr:hypothetical protein [Streptomyces liangshanensis]QIQ03392.1 hypothetical protein HA039_14545 [Streptomyces liangshanensis]
MARRPPNGMFRDLLAETGWTGEELARAVNRLGAESGLTLRYQRASVSQWAAGIRPRPPAPELLAEAFSRRLGRRVTVADVLPPAAAGGGSAAESPTPARQLVDLGRRVAQRYRAAAALVYEHDPRPSPPAPHPLPQAVPQRLTPAATAAVAAMIDVFSTADRTHGGGFARVALAAYLSQSVAPLLRAPGPSPLRRQLLLSGATLSYLCAFMHFDDELHGPAQRYYRTSLELAEAAGDPTAQALALRALSIQAHALKHHRRALDLAEEAHRRVTARTPPQVRAGILGQLAVAEAATGSGPASTRRLDQAARELESADRNEPAVGAYHGASLAHQHATVAAHLGDGSRAVSALQASLDRRPDSEPRSRVITCAALAELHFARGHLEAACATWHAFLDGYPAVSSARADTALATMRSLTRVHRRQPTALALIHRAASLQRR